MNISVRDEKMSLRDLVEAGFREVDIDMHEQGTDTLRAGLSPRKAWVGLCREV